jgi:hypothetical protein
MRYDGSTVPMNLIDRANSVFLEENAIGCPGFARRNKLRTA